MQFKSEYAFTIIRIMFNRGDKKSHANLGNLKNLIQKYFINYFKRISKDSTDLRET